MIKHSDLSNSDLRRKIRQGEIVFAGNIRLKIYGTLHCKSGKRMKRENRVFFSSEKESRIHCFRPCGHCMGKAYMKWKTH
ncbi:Ada metal-binding domain-containing protein [Fluviicola sp.]|uniref:Ada metal-binding domain-containing protein n=1 Tax=Fluviicola sp. TaxID=1917219 RepID=UPI0026188035|nr:Ada metal-binding domain-containing protein [Fluviicola sp.]